ncbi:MAG: CBS and ACT domain-containing protein [Candidatus Binatia bacterium]
MLVGKRMTKDPVTITPDDYLATARSKMQTGGFRGLPVMKDGQLVGIVTDRDLRQHIGYLEKTKVNTAIAEDLVTVTPETTLEEAAQLLLKRKIGGLPVVEGGKLVGIITTSDILRAFLDVIGASDESTIRIDLLLEGEGHDLADASKTIAEEGGEILGVGTYREKWGESPVCYLRMRAANPDHLAKLLKERGFTVLGVYL